MDKRRKEKLNFKAHVVKCKDIIYICNMYTKTN